MLSIIIPTLNEEQYIGKLLKSIKNQKFSDYEIIIADASSKDKTIKIAKSFGCRIVKGGLPPVARNNGAKKAKGDLLLFLDADCELDPGFLAESVNQFKKRKLGIATSYYKLKGNKPIDKLLFMMANLMFFITQFIDPHAPGSTIFCKKSIFKKINGFNEELKLAEDHDFVKRSSKIGKFRVMTVPNQYSMRRYEKEGRFKTLMKYSKAEFYRIFKGEIKKDLFSYEYGKY